MTFSKDDLRDANEEIARLRERVSGWKQRAEIAERKLITRFRRDVIERIERAEARAARLEECVGLLPPKWADQFWVNWREHPGLPALEEEKGKA